MALFILETLLEVLVLGAFLADRLKIVIQDLIPISFRKVCHFCLLVGQLGVTYPTGVASSTPSFSKETNTRPS